MHRIFCATPGDLDQEHDAFYKVMSRFNEKFAMPRGILFISLSIVPRVTDKRPFQGAISENIRSCRYYIQVLEDTWGPPQRNFERDYAIARQCEADPVMPMQEVALLFKKPLLPHQMEPAISELKSASGASEFATVAEYEDRVAALLARWLDTVAV